MAEIVITEFMDAESVSELAADFGVVYDPTLVDARDRLGSLLPDARALVVRNRTRVDEGLLATAPRLEVVGRLGVGLDNIDLEACERRGVVVCPASGANDTAVAEYVIAATMLLRRPVFLASAAVVGGQWPREAGIGREIAGATMGLVGFGSIAREVAQRAKDLGMSVTAYDPNLSAAVSFGHVLRVDRLEDLLRGADVVSLHVPLTESTRGLIDARALSYLREDAILVNTARGHVVDEDALVDCLRRGAIGGAALDVFADEPLTGERAARFDGTPNLVLTPHVAGVTDESNVRVGRVTAANVRRVLQEAAP